MSLRERLRGAVEGGHFDELDRLVAEDPRSVRYLLGMTYQPDEELRGGAARGVGLASRHHPELVQNNARRLVWAMNDESGTNAVTAPAVLQAIAEEQPELLLPLVPDLIRLAGDETLREGLATTLQRIAKGCPGQVGPELQQALNDGLRSGGTNGK